MLSLAFLESSVTLVGLSWLFLRVFVLSHYFRLASYAFLLFLCLSCWFFFRNILYLKALSLSTISLFFELIISVVLHSPVLWLFHYLEILLSVFSDLYLLPLNFSFQISYLYLQLFHFQLFVINWYNTQFSKSQWSSTPIIFALQFIFITLAL